MQEEDTNEKKHKEIDTRTSTFLAHDDSGASDVDTDTIWTTDTELICV